MIENTTDIRSWRRTSGSRSKCGWKVFQVWMEKIIHRKPQKYLQVMQQIYMQRTYGYNMCWLTYPLRSLGTGRKSVPIPTSGPIQIFIGQQASNRRRKIAKIFPFIIQIHGSQTPKPNTWLRTFLSPIQLTTATFCGWKLSTNNVICCLWQSNQRQQIVQNEKINAY